MIRGRRLSHAARLARSRSRPPLRGPQTARPCRAGRRSAHGLHRPRTLTAGFDGVILIVREEIQDELLDHIRSFWPAELPVVPVIQGAIQARRKQWSRRGRSSTVLSGSPTPTTSTARRPSRRSRNDPAGHPGRQRAGRLPAPATRSSPTAPSPEDSARPEAKAARPASSSSDAAPRPRGIRGVSHRRTRRRTPCSA